MQKPVPKFMPEREASATEFRNVAANPNDAEFAVASESSVGSLKALFDDENAL